MRILCFGDSYTYGYGMPDHEEGGGPSLFAYPQLLAHKFSCGSLNLASPRASNKEIWNIILQSQFCPSDIVTIMWSSRQRTCVINSPQEDPTTTDKWRIPEHVTGKFFTEHQTALGSWKDTEPSKSYYDKIYSEVDSDISTQLYISHIDFYLKSIGIKTIVHAFIPHETVKQLFWNKDKRILKFTPVDATPDGHAGKQSHINFTKIVAREILKNNT